MDDINMGELTTASKLNEIIKSDPFECIESVSDKYRCCYCGGETTDDRRGNCAACGAPRLKRIKVEETCSQELIFSEQGWLIGDNSVLGINTTLIA